MAENNCVDCGCVDGASQVMPPSATAAPCVGAEPCSSIQNAGCVVYTGEALECNDVIVVPQNTRVSTALQQIVSFFCQSVADLNPQITYAEAQALIAGEDVVPGAFYHITDRDIFLTGLSTTEFSPNGFRLMRVIKESYYTVSAGHLGMWRSSLTPVATNTVIWGGRIWTNVAGSAGSATNDYTLSGDWTLVPTSNTTYYETKAFEIIFDFANDWVVVQEDDKKNRLGVDFTYKVLLGITYNPCDYSDWGSPRIAGNSCIGVMNNANANLVLFNSNMGLILNNDGDVTRNTNKGHISFNKGSIGDNDNVGDIIYNDGEVYANDNNGHISYNTNTGDIQRNRNNGDITNNENQGAIVGNLNNGNISGIGVTVTNIQYNINNGNILTTVVGAITDPIVNK